MRLSQTLKQKPAVSPQLVLANELLQFSSLELEQAIAQELAENPALELRLIQRCPVCGAELVGGACTDCDELEPGFGETWDDRRDVYDDGVVRGTRPAVEWDDPVARAPASVTLADHLIQQARLCLPPEDIATARQLIGNLDDRGFLSDDVEDLASDIGVDVERAGAVLAVIQRLEPVGVAARDARECLLIQLAELGHDCGELQVAERLILHQWDRLGRSSLASLAQAVGASVDDVHGALRFIRENCHPYPAHVYWGRARQAPKGANPVCPDPDVIIRDRDGGGYGIEFPKAGRYRLRLSDSYGHALDDLTEDGGSAECQGWERWEELRGRARLFVRSVEQRWQTLHDLMRCLINLQSEFLLRGERHLRPLTRAQVAESMGVHESTVSRAVAGKFVELPSGEIVSLAIFFDSAAPIKCMIAELVEREETPLSDRAIARRLNEQGYDVARRTVAKYRNILNILPASLRKRDRELGVSQ
jgi:RNA polymerase sigma-54 factor